MSPSPYPSQHSSFFYALWASGAAIAAALLGTGVRPASWGGAVALMACFAAPIAIMLPSSVTFMAHIMEKVDGAICVRLSCVLLLKVCGLRRRSTYRASSPTQPVPTWPGAPPAALSPLCFQALTARPAPPSVPLPQVGLAGQAPGIMGLLSADLAVGGVAGATAVLSLGSFTPHLACALGRRGGRAVVAALLLTSLGVAGWASTRFARPFRCGFGLPVAQWASRLCGCIASRRLHAAAVHDPEGRSAGAMKT